MVTVLYCTVCVTLCLIISAGWGWEVGTASGARGAGQPCPASPSTLLLAGMAPSFWFWLVPYGGDSGHAKYQHGLVALAEGLVARGAVVRANVDYWPLQANSSNVLFRRTRAAPESFDVVVTCWLRLYHVDDSRKKAPLHPIFARRSRSDQTSRKPIRMLIDWKLGQPNQAYWARSLSHFDVIYRSHFSSSNVPSEAVRTGRVRIGGFHWTARMRSALRAAQQARTEPRAQTLLWAHSGAALMHTVRRRAQPLVKELATAVHLRIHKVRKCSKETQAVPAEDKHHTCSLSPQAAREETHWLNHTGGRHHVDYYAQLVGSTACDASGGYFFPCRGPGTPEGERRSHRGCIYQWESFKLAEMFLSGCAVFMPDLKHYQLRLANMPTPWVDYVPYVLEMSEQKALVERLAASASHSMPGVDIDLLRIGRNGRRWAERHYSPLAFADRVLADLALSDQARTGAI